jgi:tRNA(fMet)-specific endonuclease VapC
MKYLLDTNAWIELLNNPKGILARKVASRTPSELATCSVVVSELLVGVYKSPKPAANLALVQQIVAQFRCLPFDETSADHYALIRAHLEAIGQPIGPYDTHIAGIAKQHGLVVITHNVAEFSRVPALAVEDWMIP